MYWGSALPFVLLIIKLTCSENFYSHQTEKTQITQTQERNLTAFNLMAWAELEIYSNTTLFDGSNTGMIFCVLGPSSPGRVVSVFFFEVLWVGSVDGG